MVDATRVFPPGFQVKNAAGTPQSGAVLRFYNGGTSNTRTVYSDLGLSTSLGVTVTTNASGRPAASGGAGAEVLIYTGTGSYKVTAETSAGVALWSFDLVIGALDTSSFITDSITAETPVISKTTDYTIVDGDQGKVVNANPTGGTFTLTMPSAVTVGDGWRITVKHAGTANNVTVASVSSQTFNGSGTTRSFTTNGEVYTFISDGANWQIDGYGITTSESLTLTSGKLVVTPVLPRGYIDGCVLSNNSSDATNDIDISAGVVRDSTNAINITCAAMTKQLDNNWAVGSGAGFRNSAAAITDTTYHIYAVATAAGVQDYYAHTSATVATVLTALQAETGGSSYAYARRLGSITRSTSIRPFVQVGDDFLLKTPLNSYSATNPGTSAVTQAMTGVPTGVKMDALVSGYALFASSNAGLVRVFSPDQTDAAVDSTNLTARGGSSTDYANFQLAVRTDTSAQIKFRLSVSASSDAVLFGCYGWRDLRGKDA